MLPQTEGQVGQRSADKAYNTSPVFDKISGKFRDVDIAIPPAKNAVIHENHHPLRNRNIRKVRKLGRLCLQQLHNYGQRNYSELAVQQYKRLLGNKLHYNIKSWNFAQQRADGMLGCGVLNKITNIGTPKNFYSLTNFIKIAS